MVTIYLCMLLAYVNILFYFITVNLILPPVFLPIVCYTHLSFDEIKDHNYQCVLWFLAQWDTCILSRVESVCVFFVLL